MTRIWLLTVLLPLSAGCFTERSAQRAAERAELNRQMDRVWVDHLAPTAAECTEVGPFDVRGWWSSCGTEATPCPGPMEVVDRNMREEAVKRGANWIVLRSEETAGNLVRATGAFYRCPAEVVRTPRAPLLRAGPTKAE